jgi:hypothetical protein
MSKCVFNPPSPTISGTPSHVTLSVETDVTAANHPPTWTERFAPIFAIFGMPMLIMTFPRRLRKSRRVRVMLAVFFLLVLATAMTACGGGGFGGGGHELLGTPPGTYQIQIHAVAGPASGSASVTVRVQ